jgi:hypothetical protein
MQARFFAALQPDGCGACAFRVCIRAMPQEMIPAAARQGRAGVVSIVMGFALMMALDVAL